MKQCASILLEILGIPPYASVLDLRESSYYIELSGDHKTLLRKTANRNAPISEEVIDAICLGSITCVVVGGDRYGADGAALFFLKSNEDASLVDLLKSR